MTVPLDLSLTRSTPLHPIPFRLPFLRLPELLPPPLPRFLPQRRCHQPLSLLRCRRHLRHPLRLTPPLPLHPPQALIANHFPLPLFLRFMRFVWTPCNLSIPPMTLVRSPCTIS